MFVRIYPQQLKDHWEIINETIDKSIPEFAQTMKTTLLKDLMLDRAICWMAFDDEKINGVFITVINSDYAIGKKVITIVCAYAPDKASEEMFFSGYETVKKYALSQGCEFFDFYTTNPQIVKWANKFDPFWRCDYFQMKLV